MNEPFDVQKTIHDRIVMHSKHFDLHNPGQKEMDLER